MYGAQSFFVLQYPYLIITFFPCHCWEICFLNVSWKALLRVLGSLVPVPMVSCAFLVASWESLGVLVPSAAVSQRASGLLTGAGVWSTLTWARLVSQEHLCPA